LLQLGKGDGQRKKTPNEHWYGQLTGSKRSEAKGGEKREKSQKGKDYSRGKKKKKKKTKTQMKRRGRRERTKTVKVRSLRTVTIELPRKRSRRIGSGKTRQALIIEREGGRI